MADRVRPLLVNVVAPEQDAFIPNRFITNNTIFNHEIMHHFANKKGKLGLMAIKVDMAKACDRV